MEIFTKYNNKIKNTKNAQLTQFMIANVLLINLTNWMFI